MRSLYPLALVALLSACGPAETAGCDASVDTDGDGLDDCTEADLGTDKRLADTDTDGFSDKEEVECVSDPRDANETCYACGWTHADPGDLGPTGPEVGDTLHDLKMTDQCGEPVRLHDFAGEYHILFMTAQWCTSCLVEAEELKSRSTDYSKDLGIGFSYIIALFEDAMGEPPDDAVSSEYAEVIGVKHQIPVLSDKPQGVFEHTPYSGNELPGKCVLSPELEILDCYTGHGDDQDALTLIRAHAGLD